MRYARGQSVTGSPRCASIRRGLGGASRLWLAPRVALAAVGGFPLGASEPAIKAAEGALVKMTIESALVTPDEILHACEIARHGGTLPFRELDQ